ncbi:MAG: signal peptidase I [Patescibacteria group bacterium]
MLGQLGKPKSLEKQKIEEEMSKEEITPPFWKSVSSFVVEVLKIVIISLVIIIPIRYFLIKPFYVKGASMEPTFYDHEYLVIDEISYRFKDPARGDIVVFRYSEDTSQFFIKRLIGLPGETVEISQGEVVIYNGHDSQGTTLDETAYLDTNVTTSGDVLVNLASQEYFVLGDNRPYSLDSRRIGNITREDIIGKTWIRAWPFYKFKHFNNPEYNFE